MIDRHYNFSDETYQILKEDAKRARLSETTYLKRLIEKRPVIEVPEKLWETLSLLHEDLNKLPEPDKKSIAETLMLLKKKYIYGNDKTMGSEK